MQRNIGSTSQAGHGVVRGLLIVSGLFLILLPTFTRSRAESSGQRGIAAHSNAYLADSKGRASVETSNLFGVPNSTDVNQNQDYLFSDNFACFLKPAGTTTPIRLYQVGEAVPGNPNSRGDLILTGARLNNSGVAVFVVDYPQTDGTFQRSILKYTGTLQRMLDSQDIAPNSGGAQFGRNISLAGENDNGDIALVAPLVASSLNAPGQNTIFLIAANGAVTRITGQGNTAPGTGGGTFLNIALPAGINSLTSGAEVVFGAQITGGVGGFGLFAASTGGVRKIVANGDPNPLGGNFSLTSAVATVKVNPAGLVAFTIGNTIWTHSVTDGIRSAVTLGDAAPTSIGGTYGSPPALAALSESGVVVFAANVAGSAITPRGLFRFQSGNPTDVVAYAGEAAPGAGEIGRAHV